MLILKGITPVGSIMPDVLPDSVMELDPQKGHKPSNDMAFGVFLGYSMDLSEANPLTYRDDAMMKMKSDIAVLKDHIRNKIISERLNSYDFYIYVIPFNDATGEKIKLIDEMLNDGGM